MQIDRIDQRSVHIENHGFNHGISLGRESRASSDTQSRISTENISATTKAFLQRFGLNEFAV
jgi:hypothetical protein